MKNKSYIAIILCLLMASCDKPNVQESEIIGKVGMYTYDPSVIYNYKIIIKTKDGQIFTRTMENNTGVVLNVGDKQSFDLQYWTPQ